MDTFSLVVPFLDDDPKYAYGVEFGMLYKQMQSEETEIKGYYLIANQEQITLAANRLGWRVVVMKPWSKAPDQWFYLEMEKL